MLDEKNKQPYFPMDEQNEGIDEAMLKPFIRHVEDRDHTAIHTLLSSEHVAKGTMRSPHDPLSSTVNRLKEQPDRLQLVAELDDEVLGFAEVQTYFAVPRANHLATLNLLATRRDKQFRGVGSALVETVVRQCRVHWGLRRLELLVWEDNTQAIWLYDKFGFQKEGRLRDYVRSGGEFRDALAMSLLFPVCQHLKTVPEQS
ncbi:GNAT family N-acetyltransferase [uncultured Ruegeria sp.]|uniref:GNAT family N-acetyltransferase n=1 Tax=uncultured Ruegeria sp. TaxID=259304 RepID=UPI0026279859|nr:GNAT family N-acetyltransferase [uncultured Ruegeria sp.]